MKSVYNGRRESMHPNPVYRRTTPNYPSAPITSVDTSKRQANTYSGDVVTGIALLHKQAYTPVTAPIKTDPKRQ